MRLHQTTFFDGGRRLQMTGSIEWLRQRGYAELGSDKDGEFINVIRRPGEE